MMDQSVLGYDKYEKRKRYPKESFLCEIYIHFTVAQSQITLKKSPGVPSAQMVGFNKKSSRLVFSLVPKLWEPCISQFPLWYHIKLPEASDAPAPSYLRCYKCQGQGHYPNQCPMPKVTEKTLRPPTGIPRSSFKLALPTDKGMLKINWLKIP